MTAIGTVVLQGAGGNWATAKEEGEEKDVSIGKRVGTMMGKARELIDMIQRRKVNIRCVQEPW